MANSLILAAVMMLAATSNGSVASAAGNRDRLHKIGEWIMAVADGAVTATQGAVSKVWNFAMKPRSVITFSLAPQAATANETGQVTIDVSISTSRLSPAALQFDISYDLASVSSVVATAGQASIDAGKSLQFAVQTGQPTGKGAIRCLISGLNTNLIANGVIARLGIVTAPAANTAIVTITGVVASTANGKAMVTGVLAPGTSTITIPAVLSGISFNKTELEPDEESYGSVSVSKNVTADMPVTVTVGAGVVITPPSPIVIKAGTSFTNVTATGTAIA